MRNAILVLVFLLLFHSYSFAEEADFVTWQEQRYQNAVKQQYDFSCGVASLVTLFNYQFGRTADEQSVLKKYLEKLPKEKQETLTKTGVSLLELKEISNLNGFSVYVVKVPFQGLVKTRKPALLYIENSEYRHFVVFRGFEKGKVFLTDPSLGNRSLPVDDFIDLWKGNVALFLTSSNEEEIVGLGLNSKDLRFPQYQTIQSITGSVR